MCKMNRFHSARFDLSQWINNRNGISYELVEDNQTKGVWVFAFALLALECIALLKSSKEYTLCQFKAILSLQSTSNWPQCKNERELLGFEFCFQNQFEMVGFFCDKRLSSVLHFLSTLTTNSMNHAQYKQFHPNELTSWRYFYKILMYSYHVVYACIYSVWLLCADVDE